MRRKRVNKNEQSLRDLPDNVKCSNINGIGVPKGKKEKKAQKNYLKKEAVEKVNVSD